MTRTCKNFSSWLERPEFRSREGPAHRSGALFAEVEEVFRTEAQAGVGKITEFLVWMKGGGPQNFEAIFFKSYWGRRELDGN